MKSTRLAVVAALASLLMLLGVGTASAAPKPAADPVTTPVTGTTADGDFTGTLTIDRFVRQAGQIVAIGTISGTDGVTTVTDAPAALPVDLAAAAATASCEILDLVLGPLNLDLLGLVVTLDVVHLNITAEQGPGNLLGNLLCAVAGLLDGPSPLGNLLGAITALLNQILGALG